LGWELRTLLVAAAIGLIVHVARLFDFALSKLGCRDETKRGTDIHIGPAANHPTAASPSVAGAAAADTPTLLLGLQFD
jgi:hypothetical protein